MPLQSIPTGLQAHPQGTDLADNSLDEWNALYCALSLHKIHRKELIIIKDMWQGTLYSVDPGQGPKLACTVHVCTVASSLQAHARSVRGSVSLIAWNGL